jgi:ubiquinone/menaquinone biosynthesis C-methylase UbiE
MISSIIEISFWQRIQMGIQIKNQRTGIGDKMSGKRDNKWFWNRYAKLYDWETNRFSGKAYAEMYRLIANALSPDMDVLEVATGTGLIAINIAPYVRRVEATDYAPKMIEAANKKKLPANVRFSVEDATVLSFSDCSFDAVIISNALHIIPEPAKVLDNISRVLKPNGLLIAPNYSHGHIKESTWNLNVKFLKLIGFESYSKWTPEEYVGFIHCHGFRVDSWQVFKAAFPLVYLEAHKIGD